MRKYLSRKSTFSGISKVLIKIIVCTCITESFIKLILSLIYNEGDFLHIARMVSLLTSLVIGLFVWQGYTIAQLVLATERTCLGGYTLYEAWAKDMTAESEIVFYTVGTLWVLFGILLLGLLFFGKQVKNVSSYEKNSLRTNKKKGLLAGLVTLFFTVLLLYMSETWLTFGAGIVLFTVPSVVFAVSTYKRKASKGQGECTLSS